MIMYKAEKKQLHDSQDGFASIVVALVLIMVLSLITIGFAQLARREQQNALTKQLSTQAYYAAETGINDAYDLSLQPGGLYDQEKLNPADRKFQPDVCLNTTSDWKKHNGATTTSVDDEIDHLTGTYYSCVMVDLFPKTLVYSQISPDSYRDVMVAPVKSDGSATNLAELNVSWGSADSHTDLQTDNNFKPIDGGSAPKWGANSVGMIQFSVTPIGDSFNRDTLINNSFTVYMFPKDGTNTGTIAYSVAPNDNAPIVNADCSGAGDTQCNVTIENLNQPGVTQYLIHFTNYYDITNLKITGTDSLDANVSFSGGQIVIDSTGRARDVLKRLQVHVPVKPQAIVPDDAIQGGSVCKRFNIYPDLSGNSVTTPEPVGASKACNYWTEPS